MDKKHLLTQNALFNLIGTALPLGVGLISIPIVIDALGLEVFGLLTLIWTAIGYFGLFDFGMGRALTQQVALHRVKEINSLVPLIKTGLWALVLPGILGAICMHIASFYYVQQVLDLSPILRKETMDAFVWAAWCIPLVTVSSGLRGILEGLEDFAKSSTLRGVLGILNFLAPMVLVLVGDTSLLHIVWSLIAARILVVIWNVWWIRAFLKPSEKVPFTQRIKSVKSLLSFGFWMTVSNIVGPFMVAADRFIVAMLVGTSVLTYYTVPQDIVLRLLIIPAAIATAWFPRFTIVANESGKQGESALLKKGLNYIMLTLGPICLILALFSKQLLRSWINPEFAEHAWMVSIVLLVGVFFNALGHIPLAALQATGKVKTTALLHVVELCVYLPLLYIVLPVWGVLGAACLWAARTTLDFGFLLGFNHYKTHATARL